MVIFSLISKPIGQELSNPGCRFPLAIDDLGSEEVKDPATLLVQIRPLFAQSGQNVLDFKIRQRVFTQLDAIVNHRVTVPTLDLQASRNFCLAD